MIDYNDDPDRNPPDEPVQVACGKCFAKRHVDDITKPCPNCLGIKWGEQYEEIRQYCLKGDDVAALMCIDILVNDEKTKALTAWRDKFHETLKERGGKIIP